MSASATLRDTLPPRVHHGMKYIFKSDRKRRIIFLGGVLVFSQNICLQLIQVVFRNGHRTELILVTSVLFIILLLINSLLVGYFIRFLDHVMKKARSPADFNRPAELLRNGLIANALFFGAFLVVGIIISLITTIIYYMFSITEYSVPIEIINAIQVYTFPAVLLTMVRIQRRDIGLRSYPVFVVKSLHQLSSIATKRNYVYGWILVGLVLLTARLAGEIPLLRASGLASDFVYLMFNFSDVAQATTIAWKFILSISASISAFYLMTIIYYIFADLMRELAGSEQAELIDFR